MPAYSSSPKLQNDEWIVFQIKEGPCAAGCTYCYENEHIRTVLKAAQASGQVEQAFVDGMTTRELAGFVEEHREELDSEMALTEIAASFALLKQADITCAALVGSEPTSHSQFKEILDLAQNLGIKLFVYTAGMAPERLLHPAISRVILHLDCGTLEPGIAALRIADKAPPSSHYMAKIVELLKAGKKLDLRINFSDGRLREADLVRNFFEKVPLNFRLNTQVKYSFSTRVARERDPSYFTPERLRACSSGLLAFVDQFSTQFPEVKLFSERPLFPCSFTKDAWQKYSSKGGFVSCCDMEFTFYPRVGLALCPPARSLVRPRVVTTVEQLQDRIAELRRLARQFYQEASFDDCISCGKRIDLSCQGGCLGYKLDSPGKAPLSQ
jgi:pyruvate-formate lyase-activating enzyme